MTAILFGYRTLSFTNQQTGQIVDGVKFYFGSETGLRNLVGYETFDFFLSKDKLSHLGFDPQPSDIQQEFDIAYNRYGKVDSIKSVFAR